MVSKVLSRYILLLLVMVSFNACKKEEVKSLKVLKTTFLLYIGNESAEEREVDIIVKVDGVEKINESFEYQSGSLTKFEMVFEAGDHDIEISSNGGQAIYGSKFKLQGERDYGIIKYNYSSSSNIIPPRYFTFEMI